jgi:pimeloyl-ACP methyl ester carboxylesterase
MLVYIHGANATADSFNFIRQYIDQKNIAIEYDSSHSFKENLEEMKEVVKKYKDIVFIAHSLGGIYALHLAKEFPQKIKGAITISTPYGGAEVADYAKYFLPFSRLLKDIGPSSWPMKTANDIEVIHPWTNIVTVSGKSPWMTVPNDGIVTIASMKQKSNSMEIIEVNNNHYEVLMSSKVVEIIQEKLKAFK